MQSMLRLGRNLGRSSDLRRFQEGSDATLFQALRQSTTILLVALVLGFTANATRPNGLSLTARWSPEAQIKASGQAEDLTISIEEARDLFMTQGALFIDARDGEAYSEGHIEGALNLPWHDFEARFVDVVPRLTPSGVMITYCDGDSCGLSKELAITLLAKGYGNVRVLGNGWSRWQEAGLPVSR
jgi:rhodanese-related sulfurtransferase